jgi:hypothetical protein
VRQCVLDLAGYALEAVIIAKICNMLDQSLTILQIANLLWVDGADDSMCHCQLEENWWSLG